MPIETGSERLDLLVDSLLEQMAAPGGAAAQLIGNTGSTSEVAFHDFSNYRFLLTPARLRFSGDENGSIIDDLAPAEVPLDRWLDFETFAALFRIQAQVRVERWVQERVVHWVEVDDDYVREIPVEGEVMDRRLQGVILDAHEAFRLGMAPELYELYSTVPDYEHARYIADVQSAVDRWLESQLEAMRQSDGAVTLNQFYRLQNTGFWRDGAASVLGALADYALEDTPTAEEEAAARENRLPSSYPFEPFLPNSVNFGLQVVYRQSWIPLGTQPGEIVRTLPLGPRQTEKVSYKVIRRTKSTRQVEMSTSIETASESSVATKDSQEVVQEASEKFNWHVEASASGNFGFGSASLTAGMGGENASSSRDAKSMLNETMEKTTSRIRQDTKIVVTTEAEETAEFTQSSEISNPNDEIAVTYIYSRLQRQYELRTLLSEVNTVVFVAEKVPAPAEIGGAWIRRHDWIIARELLDESFRSDLEMVRSHDAGSAGSDQLDENIRSLMESFSGGTSPGLPDYSALSGQLPDIFQAPQHAYEREVERKRAREADQDQYRRALRRLAHHIYDNILHYCRAIWSAEDPDTRLMRYGKMRVPIHWELVSSGTPSGHTIEGYYAPAVHDHERDTAPLSELINPAGPIGFAGNYAAYYLRESDRWSSLSAVLNHVRMPFLRTQVAITREAGEGAGLQLSGLASENRIGDGRYRIIYEASPEPHFRVQWERAAGVFTDEPDLPAADGEPLRFHALSIAIGPLASLSSGDSFLVEVRVVPQLEDPELKALRWTTPQLHPADEAQFYTAETIAEFAEYFTDINRALIADGPSAIEWSALSDSTRALLRSRYHYYLLRKRHSRKIALDTNNLILTREVDQTSTLEPFKGLHRLADALGAFEETTQKRLESERRKALIAANRLGDPDIEKLTVVATDETQLAALDGLSEEPVEPEPATDDA